MIYPLIIKHKSSASCYKLEKDVKQKQKSEKLKQEEKIDLELSKEYIICLKKYNSAELCKDLYMIFNEK